MFFQFCEQVFTQVLFTLKRDVRSSLRAHFMCVAIQGRVDFHKKNEYNFINWITSSHTPRKGDRETNELSKTILSFL